MSLTLLLSAQPERGRIAEARASLAEARALVSRHCPSVNQWRAEIAGANTGMLYTSLTWDKPSEMAAGHDAILADPGYEAWAAKHLQAELSMIDASPHATLGVDVPGFAGAYVPVNETTTPRICGITALQLHDEVLELLPQSKARAERYGFGWGCRVWATGTGGPATIAVYNIYASRSAWGTSQDRQMADYGSDSVLRLVRPFVLARLQLLEIL